MIYLLDTDTCVYWLRGQVSVRHKIDAVEPVDLAISIISVAELYYGAECSNRPVHNLTIVDDFVNGLNKLNIEKQVAHLFASLKAELRRKGKLIEDFDLLIAATALFYEMTLVTNSVQHFSRFAELRIENWVSN